MLLLLSKEDLRRERKTKNREREKEIRRNRRISRERDKESITQQSLDSSSADVLF
jgi:hypothetical protein